MSVIYPDKSHIDYVNTLQTKVRLMISKFYMLGISPKDYHAFRNIVLGDEGPSIAYINPLVTAYNCSIFFCLQALLTDTTAGETHQRLLSTWDRFNASHSFELTKAPLNMNVADSSNYLVEIKSLNALGDAFAEVVTASVNVDSSAIKFSGAFMESIWYTSNSTATIHLII